MTGGYPGPSSTNEVWEGSKAMKSIVERFVAILLVLTISPASPGISLAQTAPAAPQAPQAPPAAQTAPAAAPAAPVPNDPWPRTISYQGATITVFQPQVDNWVGNKLNAYAAVRVQSPGKKDVDYGVIWFSARTEVDKVNRMVTLEDFTLDKQSFPTIANNGSAYANTFILNLPWSKTIPLDMLETSLAVTNAVAAQKTYQLDNTPPRIIYSITPAVLALIDGSPVLRPVGRQSAEGHQHARADPLRFLQEHVLPRADGRMGRSTDH